MVNVGYPFITIAPRSTLWMFFFFFYSQKDWYTNCACSNINLLLRFKFNWIFNERIKDNNKRFYRITLNFTQKNNRKIFPLENYKNTLYFKLMLLIKCKLHISFIILVNYYWTSAYESVNVLIRNWIDIFYQNNCLMLFLGITGKMRGALIFSHRCEVIDLNSNW